MANANSDWIVKVRLCYFVWLLFSALFFFKKSENLNCFFVILLASLCIPRSKISLHGNGLYAWWRFGQPHVKLWCSWEVGKILLCWSCIGFGRHTFYGLCAQVSLFFFINFLLVGCSVVRSSFPRLLKVWARFLIAYRRKCVLCIVL